MRPMSAPSRRRPLPRGLKVALVCLGVFAAGGFAHGPLVRAALEARLAAMGERLGLPMSASEIQVTGALSARLTGLQLGPHLAAESLDAEVTLRDAVLGPRTPRTAHVVAPSLTVTSDGSLRGFGRAVVEAVRPLRERPRDPTPEARDPSPTRRIVFEGGRVTDTAGAFRVSDLRGDLSTDGAGSVTWRGEVPDTGVCRVEASMAVTSVDCERPLALPLAEGVAVGVRRAEWLRPQGKVRVGGARLQGDGLPAFAAPLADGLLVHAETEVEADAQGRRPLVATLTLPGGGRVEATGTAGRHGASLSAAVADMALKPVSDALEGSVTGRATLEVDLDARTIRLDGDVRWVDLVVDHRAIADDRVGPYALSARGRATLGWSVPTPAAPSRVYALTLEDVVLGLGQTEVLMKASVEAAPQLRKVSAEVATGRVTAEQLVSAFPPGLLPHLQPLRAIGTASLSARIALDVERPDDTVFDVSARLDDLKVTRMNSAIDFDRLRDRFVTRFEMPNGEVIRRETGPNSERWTPLDQIVPLLPVAVVTQEDGGFWNHKGVSLLHLRGSLATNLERGRFARGGSTLTMQLARNVFLNRHKTLSRKLEEVIVAWLMEQTFSKDELITLYLNVVEFGPHLFGIGDAARHYFDKRPAELTPVEVAWLVRLLPGPRRHYAQFEAGETKEYYRTWMQRLLDLLHTRGHLPTEQWSAARPLDLRFAPAPTTWPPTKP